MTSWATGISLASLVVLTALLLLVSFTHFKQREWISRWIFLLWTFFLLILGVTSYLDYAKLGYTPFIKAVKWILTEEKNHPLTVGSYLDGHFLSLLFLLSLLSINTVIREFRALGNSSVTCASVALAQLGVVISWMAPSPWLAFLGAAFALLGQSISRRSATLDRRANHLWHAWIGLMVAVIGALLLNDAGAELSLTEAPKWPPFEITRWAGLMLSLGLVAAMGVFPPGIYFRESFKTENGVLYVILRGLLVPTALFAILFRYDVPLREAQVLEWLGWLALAQAILCGICAPFLHESNERVGTLLAVGQALVLVCLSWGGQLACFQSLVGTFVAALFFAKSADKVESGSWFFRFAGGWALFVFGGGWFSLNAEAYLELFSVQQEIWHLTAIHVALFFFSIALWGTWFEGFKQKGHGLVKFQLTDLMYFLFFLVSLAVLWRGRVDLGLFTETNVPGETGVLAMQVNLFRAGGAQLSQDAVAVRNSVILLQALLILGAIIGYWIPSLVAALKARASIFYRVLSSGFYLQNLLEAVFKTTITAASILDEKVLEASARWIRRFTLNHGIFRFSAGLMHLDRILMKSGALVSRGLVDWPGEVVEKAQGRDFQTYLLLALGLSIMMLVLMISL